MAKRSLRAEASSKDSIVLPPEAAKHLGLAPGASLDLVVRRGRVEVLPNIHSLSRVYIEPTSRCNLACRTCIRSSWAEQQGDMAPEVFAKLVEDLGDFPGLGSAMLGGFGEPTAHPRILSMVQALKGIKLRTELVSNGTLLDEGLAKGLVEAGLDRLWISLDGTEEAAFEQVRAGARFKDVVRNVRRLKDLSLAASHPLSLGIAFVVTRKNVSDLEAVGTMARKLGADRVSVSNAIPYSPEMELQMACNQALTLGTLAAGEEKVDLDLPRLDLDAATKETLWSLLAGGESLSLMGEPLAARTDECRFIRERCVCVRWDGKVSPCMGLMHSHAVFFQRIKKDVRSHSFGDVSRQSLTDIWDSAEYASFREKVSAFDFAPCHVCGGCDLSAENQKDCDGNTFPAVCGGCLWAQGVVQCP
ncbi:MAG: radical SAM protein [Elusimicrobiota bacterium]|jgi:MoaA/NifB/PqqE/SkfB family radical SAM enzyme